MPVNPFTRKGEHYIVDLQVSLKNSEYIFGFMNISHISYDKLEEIFKEQIGDERFLFDDIGGYIIDEKLYNNHKDFFDKEIPFKIDFNLFEYSVGLSYQNIEEKKIYYHKELPPFFDQKI